MVRLYVMRHGIAIPSGTLGFADDERPLTAKGANRVEEIARGLKRLKVKPDRIVTSPLPRARQTAERVAQALNRNESLHVDDALRPEHDAEALVDWLRSQPDEELLIVGHNPGFSCLVERLAMGGEGPPLLELKKGGVAALEADEKGRWSLSWIATPGLLRRIK